MLIASDSPQSIAKSMGIGTLGFAQAYARWRPEVLVVIGDRFEMHAAVVAALPNVGIFLNNTAAALVGTSAPNVIAA